MGKTFGWSLFAAALILSIIGILLIYAATYYSSSPETQSLFLKQLIWLGIGLAVCIGVYFIPLKIHEAFSFVYYFVIIVVLLVLLATSGGGARRWFYLGEFNIQPSELAKFAVVLAISRYMAFRKMKPGDLLWVFVILLLISVPAALILFQPDLGSSLVFFAVFIAMLFWSGIPLARIILILSPIISLICAFHWFSWAVFFFLLLVLVFVSRLRIPQGSFFITVNLAVGMITPIMWNKLHDYQKMRIMTFLDPGQDPRGAGYQIIQSKIAVGAGGLFGQGFLQGTQTKLNFLPEQHTDFIFSVLAEQFGFVGCLIVMLLFVWILYRGLAIALKARNQFYSYAACGLTAVLVFQVVINIGMTVGLMPVTGLPLPFMSYGGSSMVFFWAAIGFLLAVNRDWQEY
ncbi:MAG: rod shape-determining protein RodA [Candidatus Zixiibacteriota bacterium]|nr:MAG: rod shape-determining protein RodA [candidate division Zixibacteria bacterium]